MVLTKWLNQMVKKKRAPRAAADDGATEQRILNAARLVFVRRGTAGARMQEIAEEAGVNKALLHYYFRSKARLAEAVFRHGAGQLLPPVLQTLGSDLPLPAKVARVVELELDQLTLHPFLPAYILSELHHDPARAGQLIAGVTGQLPSTLGPRIFSTLQRQLDAEVRAGRFRPIGADQFVINLLSLCIFPFAARPMIQAMLNLGDKGFAGFIDRRRDELVPFFLGALRP